MNRGTANKWIELILTSEALSTKTGALRDLDGDMCVLGLLQDFLAPDAWVPCEYVGVYLTQEGKFSCLTADVMKRAKAKTSDGSFVLHFHGETYTRNIVDLWDSGQFSAYEMTALIETFYAEM